MANGQVITNNGKGIMLDRSFLGTPTKTQPSQFKVGTGTNTPTSTDTDLQTAVSIDGDNFKSFAAGFPSLDTTNNQVTFRCILLVTEANGNSLTEFGIVNSDGTPLMFSRAVHTAITKNNTTQITYIEKDKFT